MAEVEDIYSVEWYDYSPADLIPKMTVRGTATDDTAFHGILTSEPYLLTDPNVGTDDLGAWYLHLETAPRRAVVTVKTRLPVQVGTAIRYTSFRRDD